MTFQYILKFIFHQCPKTFGSRPKNFEPAQKWRGVWDMSLMTYISLGPKYIWARTKKYWACPNNFRLVKKWLQYWRNPYPLKKFIGFLGYLITPKFFFWDLLTFTKSYKKIGKCDFVMLLKCSGHLAKLEFCCKNYWHAFFPLSLQQFWFWILLLHSGPFILILSKKPKCLHLITLAKYNWKAVGLQFFFIIQI